MGYGPNYPSTIVNQPTYLLPTNPPTYLQQLCVFWIKSSFPPFYPFLAGMTQHVYILIDAMYTPQKYAHLFLGPGKCLDFLILKVPKKHVDN